MGAELGRISGPLLANNLVRNGVDLSFRNLQTSPDLLYLNVVDGRVGINTSTPGRQLDVPVKIRSENFKVDTLSSIGHYTVSTNQIINGLGTIYIRPNQSSNPTITSPGLTTNNLQFSSNLIQSTTTNSNIELYPTGTGKINLTPGSDVYVDANLHVYGSITFDGNITLGNEDTDNIVFAADVNSDILPSIYPWSELTDELDNIFITEDSTNTLVDAPDFNLGSATKTWKTIYSNLTDSGYVNADSTLVNSMYTGNLLISGSSFSNTISSNPIYLTPNGAGQVVFNGVNFFNKNSIINNSNSALTIASTRYGYTKFTGTAGITIPVGTTVNRPDPITGYLRLNTEIGAAEIYNGVDWIPAIGISPVLTIDAVYDVMDEWTLILG